MSIEDKENINYYGPYVNLFPIGDVYVAVPSDVEKGGILGISSLGPSERVAIPDALSADLPHLVIPSFYATNLQTLTDLGLNSGGLVGVIKKGKYVIINVNSFAFALNNRFTEIMRSMLNNWTENVKEQSKRIREEITSLGYLNYLFQLKLLALKPEDPTKMSGTEYTGYLMDQAVFTDWIKSLPEDAQLKALNLGRRYQILEGMGTALKAYQENLDNNGPSDKTATTLSTLAVGSTIASEYAASISGGAHTGVNPLVSAIGQMSKPLVEKGGAALGYFGSLFSTGTYLRTSDQLSLNVGRLSEKEMNTKTAHQYASDLNELLKPGSDVNTFLHASVINLQDKGRLIPEKDRQQLVDAMKFTMLVAALALVYKSETGKVTDMELGAMLTGNMPVEDDKVKMSLKTEILKLWGGLGPLQKPMTLAALEYVDSDPDMKELTDPYKVFDGIRQTEGFSGEVHAKDLIG